MFPKLSGSYDNFQQHWKENTEEAMHRDAVENAHTHIHLKIEAIEGLENTYLAKHFSGRNNAHFIKEQTLRFIRLSNNETQIEIDGHFCIPITITKTGFKTLDPFLILDGDTLLISDMGIHPANTFYSLQRCRYFDGWIQVPIPEQEESFHEIRNIQIHDQGGLAEIVIAGKSYTSELTQLVFAHKIHIMKLAIYDMPMDQVGINSRAISYTWTNPESKRIGINLRTILSGWTLMEDGYINSSKLAQES